MQGVERAVSLIQRSGNRKLGHMAVTYVSQDSCPGDCPFRGSGCYAEQHFAGITTRRLNRAGRFSPPGSRGRGGTAD